MDTLAPKASPSEARRAVFRERVGIWVQAHEEEAGRIKVHHLTGRHRPLCPPPITTASYLFNVLTLGADDTGSEVASAEVLGK